MDIALHLFRHDLASLHVGVVTVWKPVERRDSHDAVELKPVVTQMRAPRAPDIAETLEYVYLLNPDLVEALKALQAAPPGTDDGNA